MPSGGKDLWPEAADRAAFAQAALAAHHEQAQYGLGPQAGDLAGDIANLLADLMHLAAAGNTDFADALKAAQAAYLAERNPTDGQIGETLADPDFPMTISQALGSGANTDLASGPQSNKSLLKNNDSNTR
jgi:hypothetical protein